MANGANNLSYQNTIKTKKVYVLGNKKSVEDQVL